MCLHEADTHEYKNNPAYVMQAGTSGGPTILTLWVTIAGADLDERARVHGWRE